MIAKAPAISRSRLEEVKALYFDDKLSVAEIAYRLNVTLDAAYYFFRKHKISRRTHSEGRAILFARKVPSFTKRPIGTPELSELAAIGTMLYWGEGSKGSDDHPARVLDFANSDPDMIAIFLTFLRSVYALDEKKFRVLLYCYSDQDSAELVDFWSARTRIPVAQFTKPYIRKDYRASARKMRWGLVHIRYGDKKLLLDVKNMISYYLRKHAPIV